MLMFNYHYYIVIFIFYYKFKLLLKKQWYFIKKISKKWRKSPQIIEIVNFNIIIFKIIHKYIVLGEWS